MKLTPHTDGRWPRWATWLSIAAAWALFVLGAAIFAFGVWPFHGWSRADQLSLFQSAVGLAGFGGAVVGLIFAGNAIAERYGRPEFLIGLDPDPFEIAIMEAGNAAEGSFFIELWNTKRAIVQTWQLRLEVDGPWRFTDGGPAGETSISADGAKLVHNRQTPLFPGASLPVGPFRIWAPVASFADITAYATSFHITATINTEFGQVDGDEELFDAPVLLIAPNVGSEAHG